MSDEIRQKEKLLAAAMKVVKAARYIRHWHNTGRMDEGMVVSTAAVEELWRRLEEFDEIDGHKSANYHWNSVI